MARSTRSAALERLRAYLDENAADPGSRLTSRAGSEDVAYLRSRAEAGRRARDRPACEQADDAFHRAVAEVAGNLVLIAFLSFLSGARRRVAWQREWERAYRRLGVEEFRHGHSDQHMAVVDAIAGADPPEAEEAMRRHLATIRAEMERTP